MDLPMEVLYDIFDLPNSFLNRRTHCVSKRKLNPSEILEVVSKEENTYSNKNAYLKKRDFR